MSYPLYLKVMNKGFLNRDEVAKLLGISTRTVSRRIKEGKIIAKKYKGQLRFPIEQFDDIEQEQKDTTKELISILQKQLIEKDIQINKLQEDTKVKTLENQLKEKDKQISELSRALNNQQGLTKDITDKILLLPEARVVKPEEKPEKAKTPRKTPKRKKKKKGFFNKVFSS